MPRLARLSPASESHASSALLWECDPALLVALQLVVDEAATVGIGARLMMASPQGRVEHLASGRIGFGSWQVQGLRVLERGEPVGQPGLAAAPVESVAGFRGAFLLHYDHGYVASQHEYLALAQAYATHANSLLRGASARLDAIWQSAEAMMQMLAVHEPATAGHSRLVRRLVHSLGVATELDAHEQIVLEVGALLHDVGKIGVPASLLKKEGSLATDEWVIMRGHPAVGDRMVRRLASLEKVTPAIRHHHERWDGTGYPDRLSGKAIPLHARLISLADAYEAMRTGRPYQEARTPDETLVELHQMMGTQFDPSLEALLPVLKNCDLLD